MSLSSKREVCSMMETCKILHREGAKFLLRDVTLNDEHDIRSFIQFMAANPYHRIRYLNGILSFKCGRLSPETALLLRLFLEFAAPFLGLGHLRLLKPEDLLHSDFGLIQAFSRIPYIYAFSVSKPGALSFDLLSKMSGSVHMVVLNCKYSEVEDHEDSHPIYALRSLRNTLVEVVCSGVRANTTPDRCAGIVFPHVRKLRLDTSVPIDSAEYARAFPNLSSLHFSCKKSIPWGLDEEEREELGAHRARNRTLLRERGGWSTLEYCDGTPVDLWVLGLHSALERLRLYLGSMDESHQDIVAGLFEELMGDIRVKHIHLDIWMSRAVRDALRTLSRTCRDLQHLGLHVVFDPEEPLSDITGMLDALLEYVGRGSLQSLHVVFSCMDFLSLRHEDDVAVDPAPQYADECKRLLDPNSLAVNVQTCAPSLRDISLELSVTSDDTKAFRKGNEIPNPDHWAYEPMGVMRELNYELLHLVMSLCKRHELSVMMKTCKLLYLQGAKLLLSDMAILRLKTTLLPSRLSCSVAQGIWTVSTILSKFSSLPSSLVCAMVQKMRNPVAAVRVDFELRDHQHRFLPDNYHNNPILTLAPLSDTLCRLSETWGATDPAKDVYEGIIFPNVTSLELHTKDPINVVHYIHAFPNILRLTVTTSTADRISLDVHILALYGEWHNRNQTAQRAHRSWPRLERFAGTVHDWWALALECEVERMQVSDLLGWQLLEFAELLRIALPKYLVLDVRASTVVLEDFCGPFRQKAVQSLAALRVDLSFGPLDRHVLDASSMLDALVAACAGTQLQWLQVNLDCWGLRIGFPFDDAVIATVEDVPISRPEVFLCQLDLRALALRLKREEPVYSAPPHTRFSRMT
ncbi:hypothetical protein C8T65DRAFT_788063 [Cerioporus squamosus]|nr:hypothetical protein C8T65DRAFT_788063 [Cerioporus squamosus]